jgi:hypothetical protein
LATLTVAPATGSPDASVTLPLTVRCDVCCDVCDVCAVIPTADITATANKNVRMRIIAFFENFLQFFIKKIFINKKTPQRYTPKINKTINRRING